MLSSLMVRGNNSMTYFRTFLQYANRRTNEHPVLLMIGRSPTFGLGLSQSLLGPARTPELPQPTLPATHPSPRAPKMLRHATEPATPSKDPASIRCGELATPQWMRAPRVDDDEDQVGLTIQQ
jgi:hypothetical protein